MNNMNAPKILPWIARKAGITDELALKLWRRAVSEAEYLTGQTEGSAYWGLAIDRFLSIVEDEVGKVQSYNLTPAPSFPGCGVTSPGCPCSRWQRRRTRTATGRTPSKTSIRKKQRDRATVV
jgi:hypothetical protein